MTRKDRWQWVMRFAVAALALGAAPPTVDAQVVEEPWLAWIGCWVPVGGGAMDPGLCFVPASEGVVERISFTGDRIVSRQALRVDGSDSPLVIDDCEGTDALRPSADGLRFYTRSVMTCGDDEWTRAGGVMAMFTPTQWVDVRTVSQGAEPVTSAQYYQLAAEGSEARVGLPAPTPAQVDAAMDARVRASGGLQLEQVADASQHAPAAAVQAWIVEVGSGFRLDGGALVGLADAGVPDPVIDVVIALSFPDRFDINRTGQLMSRTAQAEPAGGGYGGAPEPGYWGYPGYGTGYGAAGWGYYTRGGFGYYGFGGPGVGYPGAPFWYGGGRPIYVEVSPTPPRTSKVVNGRGYTQGRSGSSGGASSQGYSSGRSDSGDGGSVSSGSSAPSRGTSTGRKAKRRGGG